MAVRWYLRHPLSVASVMELLAERGIDVNNGTVLPSGPCLLHGLASSIDYFAAGNASRPPPAKPCATARRFDAARRPDAQFQLGSRHA